MSDFTQSVDSLNKKAMENKDKGLDGIKTNCLLCKFKPNYDLAIPHFKEAAKCYNGLKNYKEEIFCRFKLVECFNKTKSLWEEAYESEKIAFTQVQEFNDYNEGLKTITNAHMAYYEKGEYQDAVICIDKMVQILRQNSRSDLCEKLLEINYNSYLKFGHVVICKNEACDYIYKSFNIYAGILLANDKTRILIERSDSLAKSVEAYEKDKSEIFNLYLLKYLGRLINEDPDNEIDICIKQCQEYAVCRDDSNKLESALKLKEAIKNSNSKLFSDNLYEVTISMDNEINKKLKALFDKNNNGDNNKENDKLNYVRDSELYEDEKDKYL